MAEGFKCLAQATLIVDASGDLAETVIYTVPDEPGKRFASRNLSQAIISSIIVCCTATGGDYSIRISKSGESNDPKQYIFFNKTIAANATDVLALGIGLLAGDRIMASIDAGTAHMNIFGTETS